MDVIGRNSYELFCRYEIFVISGCADVKYVYSVRMYEEFFANWKALLNGSRCVDINRNYLFAPCFMGDKTEHNE
jgi:hypothetical protein